MQENLAQKKLKSMPFYTLFLATGSRK